MKREKHLVGYLLMAGLVALAGCKGGHENKPAPKLPVVQVSMQEVKTKNVRSQIEVVGTVQATQHATIAPRISGQIVEMPVVLGSQVHKGNLLVKISAGEISARLLQAQAQLEQVRRNLAREEKLQKQEASTREAVKSLQDQARIAESAQKEAQTMLEYATITAPFTGIVTRKIASVGDLASPGVALLELENEKVLQVVAQVPEGLILKVRKGDVLPVSIPAAELSLNGEVAEVAPAADPSSRTASVKINITAGADIRPGQFARVTLTGSEEKFLTISDKAVLSFGQMERVFLIEDADQGGPSVASVKEGAGTASVARLRLVRTGARYDGQVEILAGLAPGDRVVVSGGEKLQDGQPLDVQPQAKNGSILRAPKQETERP
ncbi:MAG: efflux RND transporter periplasmic adaptor subunit [Desulfocapsaceae bacterium]|nr:efflux RND transporter periplasmic adaptor subunit [Desulfocapsaceae bacterium]